MSATIAELLEQWRNPGEITTVLMIIGGDVVRTALAQSAGKIFTPVCFSFGWVSYIFIALINVLGDGRLLPPPDYPVRVFNLDSGYVRDNKNWVVGRIVRDHEAWISRKQPCVSGIRISLYEAKEKTTSWTQFSYDRVDAFGFIMMALQLVIAAIPIITHRQWSIMLITASGTLLALCHGALPQWVAEKLPNRQHSDIKFALTTGNGSKDIMIIKGMGNCLNLEEWAVTDTPRNGRPWEKFEKVFARKLSEQKAADPRAQRAKTIPREATVHRGLPRGFWVTLITTIIQTCFWLMLLITVAAVRSETWYVLLIGAIGMFQNGWLAALERPPAARNLPLQFRGTITRRKVMDGLMDLQDEWQCARPLVKEFFPGDLRPDEKDWWNGKRMEYELKRSKQAGFRGLARGDSRQPEKDTELQDFMDSPSLPETLDLPTHSPNPFGKPKPAAKSSAAGMTRLRPEMGRINEMLDEGPADTLRPRSPAELEEGDIGRSNSGRRLQHRRLSPSWS